MYDKFVIKFNAIDAKIPITSALVTKKKYDSYEQCLEKKTEDVDRKDTQC